MYSDLQTDHFGDIDFRMLNGRLDRDELVRQMREMKAQGSAVSSPAPKREIVSAVSNDRQTRPAAEPPASEPPGSERPDTTNDAPSWEIFFQSYVQTYLERDVRKLAQVADLSVFYAFLKAAAARSGQMLNYSDLARDTGISVPNAL